MTAPPKMRIGIFIYSLYGGGAQHRILTLANGFAERGHAVDLVIVSSIENTDVVQRSGVEVISLEQGWHRAFKQLQCYFNTRGLLTACALPLLARYLRNKRPDVLLSGASHVNLVAAIARRISKTNIPLVLRASNYPSGNIRWWPPFEQLIRRLLRYTVGIVYPWADHIIAVSKGVASDIQRLTGLPDNRVTVIYNPVVGPEIIRQASESVDHVWVTEAHAPLILAVGRLTVQKDYPTLLRAFAQVRATRAAHLVILGEGRQRHTIEKLVHKLGLDADVAFPGHVENPFAWMSKASVLVLSSAWEGLPGVLIEALACGCPVVSTDCPSGPREILEDGAIGPLVPVHDDKALASAILMVLKAPPDRMKLRNRSAFFSIDTGVEAYLSVLAAQVASCDSSPEQNSVA